MVANPSTNSASERKAVDKTSEPRSLPRLRDSERLRRDDYSLVSAAVLEREG